MKFFGDRKDPSVEAAVPSVSLTQDAALNQAYERGRRDERARRRRRSPLATLAVSGAALLGVGLTVLAVIQGSFAAGGQVVDRRLSVAAAQAQLSGRDAALGAGEAFRGAGGALRERIGDRAG